MATKGVGILATSALALLLSALGGFSSAAEPAAETVPEELYQAMEWRLVGPYRGGRVTAVTGVPSRPHAYYMGATGGGVWKTENAGHNWANVSDGFFNTTSIGAVAVSLSDANVVYVGTGESPIRGVTTSHGDGVYKSTDAGKTWSYLGLAATRQISKVRIHPENPDVVYVAAQGNPWGANPERGVYRSKDGGASWQLVLAKGEDTGAVDLAMDPSNPRILYAAMWDHRRRPWFVRSGGPGSGLYKTTDGGDTWTRLGNGFPQRGTNGTLPQRGANGTLPQEGTNGTLPQKGTNGALPELMGKIGVAVSAADPERVYAVVEAEEGGLYRSDDAGDSWRRLNSTRVIQARSWYYHHIVADPVDENTVWVLNVPLMKSIDGGKTFEAVKTAHGDHHDLWIHPENNRIMINGNDGGAAVTFDGGETWSTLNNQPTAQFYRVTTDRRFPYYIYGGQQDNSTVAIASRSLRGGIGGESWYPVGGGESAHIAFDPDHPRLVYATSINATVDEYDVATGAVRSIRPYPEYVFGRDAVDHKYRANWNAPIAVSAHDPRVLYYGTQVLLESTDRGHSWREISGDLTRNERHKQGSGGGPITNEQAGAELYNTILTVTPSPHEQGVIWVGSDDGLVHLTRDGGESWANVTPEDADGAQISEAHINSIEVSPHHPAAAWVAVAGYKMNDFTPRIYLTRDYGVSWTKRAGGLPEDTFVRAVREDPDRQGLLYAGTETGVFVSFDAGAGWQSLQLDLPEVAVTDLAIRDQDLIAATQGRGFWVLDDLTPLHQIDSGLAGAEAHLSRPRPAYRLSTGGGGQPPHTGENPATGAVIYYYLKEVPEQAISLEILDAGGSVIRTFSSEEREQDRCARDNSEPHKRKPIKLPGTEPGMNRWVWDLRREQLHCVADVRLFRGWRGARVVPGSYTVRLTAGGQVQAAVFEVLPDPRREVPADDIPLARRRQDFAELDRHLAEVTALFNQIMASVDGARRTRSQIENRLELAAGHAAASELRELARPLIDRITAWEEAVVQPRHETYDDDINWPNMLDVQTAFLISDADGADAPPSDGARARLRHLEARWAELASRLDEIRGEGIRAFNDRLAALAMPVVYLP